MIKRVCISCDNCAQAALAAKVVHSLDVKITFGESPYDFWQHADGSQISHRGNVLVIITDNMAKLTLAGYASGALKIPILILSTQEPSVNIREMLCPSPIELAEHLLAVERYTTPAELEERLLAFLSPAKGGRLVVIEGCDGVGKTTQGFYLASKLCDAGVKASFLKFPNESVTLGREINSFLKRGNSRTVMPWLFSVNRFACVDALEWCLWKGVTVVCDRYVLSNIAYYPELKDEIYHFEFGALKLPKPDYLVFLDLPPDVAKAAMDASGREMDTNDAMDLGAKEVIRQAYLALVSNPAIATKSLVISCVRGGERLSFEEIHQRISSFTVA